MMQMQHRCLTVLGSVLPMVTSVLLLSVVQPGCVTNADKLDLASKDYLASLHETTSGTESRVTLAEPAAEELEADGAQSQANDAPVENARTPKSEKAEVSVRLSLRKCLELALRYNTDIQVAEISVLKQDTEILAAKGVFDPLLFSDSFFQRTDEPADNSLTPGGGQSVRDIDEASLEAGLKQLLLTGAELNVSQKMTFLDSNNVFVNPNPQYGTFLGLTLTQPLLRGFGASVTTAAIRVASANYDVSVWDFEQKVAQLVTDVEATYWRLVSAMEQIRVVEVSLALAEEVERREVLRLKHGEGTSAELERARAAVATREGQLIAATGEAQDISDELKLLVNGPDVPLRDDTHIVPADGLVPEAVSATVERPSAMSEALQRRPEIRSAVGNMEAKKIALGVAKNERLPKLDVELQYGLSGLGAGRTGTWDMQSDGRFVNWSARLLFEVPLGNRTARARHVKAQLESAEAAGILEQVRQQILLEVSKAIRAVKVSARQVKAARRATEAMKRTLEGEQAKLDLGVGTIKDLLEAQEDLARTEQDFTLAVLRLYLARLELDHAEGTLLAKRQVEIASGRGRKNLSEPRLKLGGE